MKLSEIRPCDNCGGKIVPMFYVVRFSVAMFAPRATNEMLGLTQMFGGSLQLAEVMGADPEAVKIAGDEEPALWTDLLICQDCFMGISRDGSRVIKPLNLALLAEKVSAGHAAREWSEVQEGERPGFDEELRPDRE